MRVEDADPELRDLTEKVFTVAEWLSGERPQYHEGSGWYKCGKPILAWFYLTGQRARKHPINSILVTATKSDEKSAESAERIGNNMFGAETPEFIVKSGDSHSLAGFLEFIGRIYKARHAS